MRTAFLLLLALTALGPALAALIEHDALGPRSVEAVGSLFGLPVTNASSMQDYANLRTDLDPPMYHAGLDLAGDPEITAPADGVVELIQPNDVGCAGPHTGDCDDHGFGNTVILRHSLSDGGLLYTQYSHLASFASGLNIGDCIAGGTAIGVMGGTGYGLDDWTLVHLHFEAKNQPVLGSPSPPNAYWGYTPTHPDNYGYTDPNAVLGTAQAVKCETAKGVAAIAAGGFHTCALTTAGGLQCWGDNSVGQLGAETADLCTVVPLDEEVPCSTIPVDVVGLSGGVTAVTASRTHTCALTTAGGVKCWGHNGSGQLGAATTELCTVVLLDEDVPCSTIPMDVVGLGGVAVAITAGDSHTCALTAEGGVKCWGANHGGQLGNGTTTDEAMPVDVIGLTDGVAAIAAGGGHTCALNTVGGVKCWGWNWLGQLGAETSEVCDGAGSSAGSVIVDLCSTTPVDVEALGNGVAAIAAGEGHTCAVTAAGGLMCWGLNDFGKLGDGTSGDSCLCLPSPFDNITRSPVEVVGLGSEVRAVAAGTAHTCALTTAGGAKCWGWNELGQLGDGTPTKRTTPADVLGLWSGVAAVTTGVVHSCALTTAGGVKCWGASNYGQLGAPTLDTCYYGGPGPCSTTPVDVLGLGPKQTPTPTPTPTATLTPTATPTAIAARTATATPGPSTTPTPPGLPGDADGDGVVRAIDALLILQFYAGLIDSVPEWDLADANGDGNINAIDAALVLQYVAGLIDSLPP